MPDTIYEQFREAAVCRPHGTALTHSVNKTCAEMTYGELLHAVDTLSANLRRLGLRKGDAVGIFSRNRPEWVIADLAALKLGCVVVPMPPSAPASYFGFMAIDARIKLVFAESESQRRIIRQLPPYQSPVKIIVLFEENAQADNEYVLNFRDLLKAGASPFSITEESDEVRADDLATVVYTSGTTGEPKGVMLTHRNILANVLAVRDRFQVTASDLVLSYLPLSHMFERTCGYYAILFAGGTIAYAQSPATLAEDMQAVRPTLLLAVPSVIEKAYRRVVGEIAVGPALKRATVALAVRILNAYANRRYRNRRVAVWLKLLYDFSYRFVASKFQRLGGGRLRVVATGGAPLDRKIAKLYHILGFTIVEGYGLTEAAPIVACHTLQDRVLGTVGKPLEGVEILLGEDSEILVRGPNIMRGYLNRTEDTDRVIDRNGWFHTGDQGAFDDRGNLVITGRLKDILVLSNGEKVSTAAIESRLTRSPYIAQAALFGNGYRHIAALIVPDREALEKYARQNNIAADHYGQLQGRQEIHDLIEQQVAECTAELLPCERVRDFTLLEEPFSVENGLLTLTIKIRRNKIEERYRALLDQLCSTKPPRTQSHGRETRYAA